MKKIIAAALVSGSVLASSAQAAQDGAYCPMSAWITPIPTPMPDLNVRITTPVRLTSARCTTVSARKCFISCPTATKSDMKRTRAKPPFRHTVLICTVICRLAAMALFTLLGTVGVGEYTFRKDFSFAKKQRDHGIGWRAGLGAMFNIDQHWGLRLLARCVNLNQVEDLTMMEYSAGIRYTF